MIEVVYSGEEHEEQDEVRIPKNIHQIGNNSSNKKNIHRRLCNDIFKEEPFR